MAQQQQQPKVWVQVDGVLACRGVGSQCVTCLLQQQQQKEVLQSVHVEKREALLLLEKKKSSELGIDVFRKK